MSIIVGNNDTSTLTTHSMNESKKYKYNRADFQPLPVDLRHMDIHLNFLDGKVIGNNRLRMTTREALSQITLDADDLEIVSVSIHDAPWSDGDVSHEYIKKEHKLVVTFPEQIAADTTFSLSTETICIPTDNILEGIYHDTTPAGYPQQYMSQCEHLGFERILPVFDDCTAKCTFVTTLEADAQYTHLISNGNISKELNPDGKPVLKDEDNSRQVITYINDIPMAPYLFIATVGTWDMLEDEVVYPSGRQIKLEYLVPPGKTDGALLPMKILKDSILWQEQTQGYEYQREVYRTICMEKSNFGGMENVGNTTIVTSAALIDEWTSDLRLHYAYGVIIHEWEHNQCGSDVTMETGFDMWLNEAFTVDVERAFVMSQFDATCTRLDEIDSMRAPISGPLAIEDGGQLGNIVREGYNNPDEVVDGVTYVKAAEVIRMLRMIIGHDAFHQGKNLYFKRYDGKNANTDQFLACFEESSGRDLAQFKQEWLFTIGYPQLDASHRYDETSKTLNIDIRQSRAGEGGLFHLPLELAAVDENGNDIPETASTIEITKAKTVLKFENVVKPAFVSYNRDCSFYGTFSDKTSTHEDFLKQIFLDPNRFNRVEAMRRITDEERIKLINNIDAEISTDLLNAYALVLTDPSCEMELKSYLLRIDEQSLCRKYIPYYRERYAARKKLMKAIAAFCMDDLLDVFKATDTYAHSDDLRVGLEARKLKSVLLRTIVEANTPEVYALAVDHFDKAWHISEKTSALACVYLSDYPDRHQLMDKAFTMWRNHLNAYCGYLSIVAAGVHDDVFDNIAREESRDCFILQHPSHNRALFLPMTANNKMLWTDKGIKWLTDTVIRLAPMNEVSTLRILSAFQQVHNLSSDLKQPVESALETMRSSVNGEKCPAVIGRINAYLK